MTSTRLLAADERALGLLAAGLAGLHSGGGRSLAQKVEVLRRVEVIRRKWASLEHALINDVDAIEVQALGAPDMSSLLVRELHLAPGTG